MYLARGVCSSVSSEIGGTLLGLRIGMNTPQILPTTNLCQGYLRIAKTLVVGYLSVVLRKTNKRCICLVLLPSLPTLPMRQEISIAK